MLVRYRLASLNRNNTSVQNFSFQGGKSCDSKIEEFKPVNIRRRYTRYDIESGGKLKKNPLLKNPFISRVFDLFEINLKNIRTVDEYLIRGSMPTTEYDMARLKKWGVTDVISLYKPDNPKVYRAIDQTKEAADKLGINYHYYPINEESPEPEKLNKAFEYLKKLRENGKKTYVHCYHGKDRTGGLVFLYEKEIMGKTAEQALDNMLKAGHNYKKYPTWLQYLSDKYPEIKPKVEKLQKK